MYRLSTQMCKYLHFEVSIYVNTYTVKTMMSNIIEIQYIFWAYSRVCISVYIFMYVSTDMFLCGVEFTI